MSHSQHRQRGVSGLPWARVVCLVLLAVACAPLRDQPLETGPSDAAPANDAVTDAAAEADADADVAPASDTAVDLAPQADLPVHAPDAAEVAPVDQGALQVCAPRSVVRCQGSALVTCNDSGTGTNAPFDCPAGCNSQRLECNVCAPGGQTCNGARLDGCRPDGAGLVVGTCSLTCLPAGGCCSDLDCGRCGQLNPCRRCGADNRCQDANTEPACNTQGACSAEAVEVCRQHGGATCEVRMRRDSPCRYQLCRWADVPFAACGLNGNRGIPTEACGVYSMNNPGAVPPGLPGACATQVENLTGAPFVCF